MMTNACRLLARVPNTKWDITSTLEQMYALHSFLWEKVILVIQVYEQLIYLMFEDILEKYSWVGRFSLCKHFSESTRELSAER